MLNSQKVQLWGALRSTALVAVGIVLALLSLFSACVGGRRGENAAPASLSRFPEQLSNSALQPSGVFQDGWVAGVASLNLTQPDGSQILAVKGMIPKIDNGQFRTDVQVAIDGRPVAQDSLEIGDFALEIPVSAPAGRHRVTVSFSKSQLLPGGDGRSVGAKVAFVGFQAAPRERNVGSEVVRRGSGIRLGSGWGVLETFNNETFRWVANDAQILVTGFKGGTRRFTVVAEPGPGLNTQPFLLRVMDASGRQVDAVEFTKRGSADVFVPVEAGQEAEFRLHVDGGGKSIPKDPRILNFRVFAMEGQ